MEAGQHGFIISSEEKNLTVSNGMVLVKLVMRDGGYSQEFYAADAKGDYQMVLSSIHKDLIPSSEHRACASPMISGERDHLFAVCRESLRMVFSDLQFHRPNDHSVVIQLSGSAQSHSIVMRITIEAHSNVIHVCVDAALPGTPPVLEYLMSSYAFLPDGKIFRTGESPEFTWAPSLRPTNDAVIGDSAFFSPAAITRHKRFAAALIPDLDMLRRCRSIPASLDLDLNNGLLFAPLISYGFCDYELDTGRAYYRHDITMSHRLKNNRLSYGYNLIVDADCKSSSIIKHVASFLWDKYAPVVKRLNNQSSISNIKSPILPDARAAYGLWADGLRHERQHLIDEAKAIRNAVLSSPQQNGLFATRFDRTLGFWHGCNHSLDSGYYSTVECSSQLYWLLKLHSDFQPSPKTLDYARRYADYLISARLRSGAIPCWFTEDLTAISALRTGAPTAASALFLAKLAKITGLRKYQQACEMSSRFIIKEIIPKKLFLDYMCIDPRNAVSLDCADPHTGMRPMSASAMLWIAQLCLDMHTLTGNKVYLKSGLEVFDMLCLMQSVGDKPWMGCPHGMHAQGNVGPHPDPEITANFALCAMRYGALTNRAEYFERGAAALHAASNAECDDLSKARIAAVLAVIRDEFGNGDWDLHRENPKTATTRNRKYSSFVTSHLSGFRD